MDLWGRMAEWLLRLIDEYDDQAIFLLMFLEESGIPLPLPGDVYMMLAGYRVAQGKMNLVWALVLIEAASLLGASVLYWLSARGGRPLLYRFGRFVHLDRAKLDRAEHWLERHGPWAIVLGRLIPGLRMPTVIAAGVFGVPYRTFLPAFALGSFGYILVFVLLGMWAGPRALEAFGEVRLSLRAILSVVLFLGLGGFLLMMYRRAEPARQLPRVPAPEVRKLETTALAALLATLEMGSGVNLMLYVLSAADTRLPERTLIAFLDQAAARLGADDVSLRLIAIGLVVLHLGSLGWAILYSHLAVPLLRVPPWLRGLVFSLLPLAVSVLIVMPALGAGPLGLGLGAGLLPFAGEVFRNVLFGVGLATSYSLLHLARQRPLPTASASMRSG